MTHNYWTTEEQDKISNDEEYLAKVDPIDSHLADRGYNELEDYRESMVESIKQDPELMEHYGMWS